MTDFGYFGMAIGIVVIVVWIFASVFIRSAKDVAGLVGYYSNKSKLKKGGYYELPESPPDFFEKRRRQYRNEIINEDYRRLPCGIAKRVIEQNIVLTHRKNGWTTADIAAQCLASLDEIRAGYRPTYVPGIYPLNEENIWECIKNFFPKEYKEEEDYTDYIGEKVLIERQQSWDRKTEKKRGPLKEVD